MNNGKTIVSSRKGQSFIEYTMLIIIVSAGLVAMTAYLMRAANARLMQEQQELSYYKAER